MRLHQSSPDGRFAIRAEDLRTHDCKSTESVTQYGSLDSDASFVMLELMSAEQIIRTTVALPEDLLTAIDRFVSEGRVVSRNELVVNGLRAHVQQLERDARDAEFQAMTDDPAYQAEARQILGEFADADREAWVGIAEES